MASVLFFNSIDPESSMPANVRWNRERIQEDVWPDYWKPRSSDGISFILSEKLPSLLAILFFFFVECNLVLVLQTSYAEFMADVQASTSHGMNLAQGNAINLLYFILTTEQSSN